MTTRKKGESCSNGRVRRWSMLVMPIPTILLLLTLQQLLPHRVHGWTVPTMLTLTTTTFSQRRQQLLQLKATNYEQHQQQRSDSDSDGHLSTLCLIKEQLHNPKNNNNNSIAVTVSNITTTITTSSSSSSNSSLSSNSSSSSSSSSSYSASTGNIILLNPEKEEVQQEEFLLRFGAVGHLYSKPSSTTKISNQNGNYQRRNDHDDADAKNTQLSMSSSSDILHRLVTSHVLVVGVGGVGSWAAEALVRSGIGHLTLIDLDDICISNTNRQLHTTIHTIGQFKIDAVRQRLRSINPQCRIHLIHDFISPDNVAEILQSSSLPPMITMCLDAIDHIPSKTALMAACTELQIPIITCGGSAGRTDPTQFIVQDLTMVQGDPLLSLCRKNLRKYHGFPSGMDHIKKSGSKHVTKVVSKWNILAVSSTEPTKKLCGSSSSNDDENENDGKHIHDNTTSTWSLLSSSSSSSLRRCDGALGTACFVTGTAGFVAASKVVEMIAHDAFLVPKRPFS
jgi:tRNA threonylcarbamoyladenosine dehydratase